MALAELIRGNSEPREVATATPAIAATQQRGTAGTIATVATVAVANSQGAQSATPHPTADPATASHWWLIHYPDRDPVEVAYCPPATYVEVVAGRPDAIAAEPFEPIQRPPTAPLTAGEEAAIRAWLAHIEETDRDTITEVLDQCRTDAGAQEYFIGRAGEAPLASQKERLTSSTSSTNVTANGYGYQPPFCDPKT